MSLGFLVAPALVGFLFLFVTHETRFALMRLSGYQVIFISALTGLAFLVLSRISVLLLDGTCAPVTAAWKAFAPFDHSGALGLGIGLALAGALLWNGVTDRASATKREARWNGNQIVWLLLHSLAENRMVEVTLKSNKSYVGYAQDAGTTTHRADPNITLIPMMSGYRDRGDPRTQVDDLLWRAHRRIPVEGKPAGVLVKFEDFQVAFPFSEIVSARLFDPEVHSLFQRTRDTIAASAGSRDHPDNRD